MRSTYTDDVANSLYNYLYHELLENGAYVNVATGDATANGISLSKFYPVIDKKISSTAGYVWQSVNHNMIFESGVVNAPAPTVISGVYINGAFSPKSGGSNPHIIDFDNGRVIFNTPVTTTNTVLANFSYSEFSFVRPTIQESVNQDGQFRTNSQIWPTGIPASPDEIFLPVIIMEKDSNTDKPFQLGGVNSIAPTFKFTVLSEKQYQIEQVADLFCALTKKSFAIVPMAEGPVFNALGDLTQNYSFYDWRIKSSNIGTFESVMYNRYPDTRQKETEPEIFAGIIRMEIFALRI